MTVPIESRKEQLPIHFFGCWGDWLISPFFSRLLFRPNFPIDTWWWLLFKLFKVGSSEFSKRKHSCVCVCVTTASVNLTLPMLMRCPWAETFLDAYYISRTFTDCNWLERKDPSHCWWGGPWIVASAARRVEYCRPISCLYRPEKEGCAWTRQRWHGLICILLEARRTHSVSRIHLSPETWDPRVRCNRFLFWTK